MLASQASTTPAKPTTLATSEKDCCRSGKGIRCSGVENKIRERAYQLYEGRGSEPGKDKQDWLQAEHEILKLQP